MKDRTQGVACRPVLRPLSSVVLLGLCMCILALRVTYTESPTAQTTAIAGGLTDAIYSLTLSGLLIFASVGWLVYRILGGRLSYRVTGIEIGLVLFWIAAAVSSLGASDKRAAINQTVLLVGPVLAALLLAQILDRPAKVRAILTVMVALGIVSAYQCAEQLLLSNTITIEQYEKDPNMLLSPLGIEPGTFQQFLFEHRLYSRGIRGFFTTSNSAASFAICASFAAIALLIGRFQNAKDVGEAIRKSVFACVATALAVLGLLMTQSKGGIMAFVAGLGVFGILMLVDYRLAAYRRRVLGATMVLLVVIVAAGGCLAVQYGMKHGRLPGGNSMLVRWQYWGASVRMYADHPLVGVGPGNFSDYYPHYKPAPALESVADPHNWLLSLLTQYGPLGVLGFLAMVGLPLWRSALSTVTSPSSEDQDYWPMPRLLAVALLVAVGLCLLMIRPVLMPTSGSDDPGVWLYEVIALFVAPAAAFVIGLFLATAPFDQNPSVPKRVASSALFASSAAAIVAVLLHNLIDFAIFEPGVWMSLWLLVACLVATRSRREPVSLVASNTTTRMRWLVAIAAVVLAGIYLMAVWMPVYRMTMGIAKSQRAISSGRLDLAHEFLAKAALADRLSPAALSFDGRLYLQQYGAMPAKSDRLPELAIQRFQEAIARSPADYKNYEKVAISCAQLGRLEQAYEWYLKAAEVYPSCDRLWFELGRLADRLDQPRAALGHFQQAVAIEDAYRAQFRTMYPERNKVVSRLGEEEYRWAQERIAKLAATQPEGSTTQPPPP